VLLVNVDAERTFDATRKTTEGMENYLDNIWLKSKFDPVDRREIVLIELFGKAVRNNGSVLPRFLTTGKGDTVEIDYRIGVFDTDRTTEQRLIESFKVLSPAVMPIYRRAAAE
jgi:hypothetical protein